MRHIDIALDSLTPHDLSIDVKAKDKDFTRITKEIGDEYVFNIEIYISHKYREEGDNYNLPKTYDFDKTNVKVFLKSLYKGEEEMELNVFEIDHIEEELQDKLEFEIFKDF